MSAWVVAVAAVIEHEGRILAMRRAATKDAGAGLWETLSGRVEPGESPLDAVCRETLEESGLRPRFIPFPLDAYTASRNGSPMLVLVYGGRAKEPFVTISEEHDEFQWVTPIEFATVTTLPRLAEAVRVAARGLSSSDF